MDKSKQAKSGIRPGVLIGVVAVVMVVGVFVAGRTLGWFGGKRTTDGATDTASAPAQPDTPETAPVFTPKTVPSTMRPTLPVATTTPGVSVPPPVDVSQPAEMIADWSTKLDDILGSDDDEAKKADLLLAIWRRLPEDGQVETMQHISNLLPDERFSSLVPAFTNAATPEAVLDILMTDTLNRPNGLKLPALLDVARTANHPKAEEARDILEVFVDNNYGADWPKWEQAMKDWLKENPDEPEPAPTTEPAK